MSENTISVVNTRALVDLFGTCDQHLRKIRESLGVSISVRDEQIHIRGDEQAVAEATKILEQLQAQAHRQGLLAADDVSRVLAEVREGQEISGAIAMEVYNGRQVRPKTAGQSRYLATLQ